MAARMFARFNACFLLLVVITEATPHFENVGVQTDNGNNKSSNTDHNHTIEETTTSLFSNNGFGIVNQATGMTMSPKNGDDTGNEETGMIIFPNNEANGGNPPKLPITDTILESPVGRGGPVAPGTEDEGDSFGLSPTDNFTDPEQPQEDSLEHRESILQSTNVDPDDLSDYYQCRRSSCKQRCNTPAQGQANCRCDTRCLIFGDCCYDYFSRCQGINLISLLKPTKRKSDVTEIVKNVLKEKSHTGVHTAMYLYRKCETVASKHTNHSYWMLSTCPKGSDEQLQAECTDTLSNPLANVPVSLASYPDLVFRNIFCALCNGIRKEELVVWSTSATCPGMGQDVTYEEFMSLLNSSKCFMESSAPPEPRQCTTVSDNIHHCPIDEDNIDPKSLSCRSYRYHVFDENDERFPNWQCGSCGYQGPFRNTSFVCEVKPDTFTFNGLDMTVCEGRSCEGRCGVSNTSMSNCSCDSDCLLFGDCCYDYISVCLNQTYTLNETNRNESLIYTLTETPYATTVRHPRDNGTAGSSGSGSGENEDEMKHEDLSESQKLKLLYVNYRTCQDRFVIEGMFWTIGQCPDRDKTSLCYQSDSTNRSLIAPVSVRGHPIIVFKNIHCALCHGIRPESVIPWSTFITCDAPVYLFESEESLLQSKKCSLKALPMLGVRSCFNSDLEENHESNQVSPQLCRAYRYPVYQGGTLLRNPHCNKNIEQLSWPTCFSVHHELGPSFDGERGNEEAAFKGGLSILFNFKDDGLSFTASGKELRPTNLCQEDEVYDDRNEICKRLHCQNGKIATNGTCIFNGTYFATEDNMVFPNGSRSYVVEIYLVTERLIQVLDLASHEAIKLIEDYLYFESIDISPVSFLPQYLQRNALPPHHDNITQVLSIILVKTSGNLKSHLQLISQMKEIFLEQNPIQIIGVSLKNYVDDDELLCLFGAVSKLNNPVVSQLDNQLYANETDKLYPLDNIPFILDISNEDPVINEALVCEIPLDCDPVTYNLTGFIPEGGDLQDQHSDLIMSNGSYFISGELVYYCHNFTRGPFIRAVPFFQFDPVQDILSYISSAISLTSLLVTLFVYTILPKLRNLPGRLTMSLSVSLFLAQTLLLFIHVPKGIFCKALAIALHYLWLSTFMWMTAMSINVARTFTNQLKGSVESIAATHFKYAICAHGIPALVVLLSTLMEYLAIQGVEIGYGKRGVCWIANPRASLLSFGVPLALMLLVNLVTFIITFYNIEMAMRSSQNISSTQKDRNKVMIYCKLFVMMGLSWGFSFAAAFADVAAMWYMFILLNGLQGFYIFLSFICTDRVKALLKKKLSGQESEVSQSKTQSISISKI